MTGARIGPVSAYWATRAATIRAVAGDLFVVRDPEGRYAGIHVNEEHAHGHDHEH